MAGSSIEGDLFIGKRAQELRGLLRLKYPMEHGVIVDFDDMEKIWSHIYTQELKTLSEEVRSSWRVGRSLSSHDSTLCC
jgi:centractin